MGIRNEEKRGWMVLVLAIAGLLIVLSFIYPERGWPGQVTLAWDANTEENLAGYKIYYGKQSRYDPTLLLGIPATIVINCNLPASGPLTESQQSCKDSWEKYCTCSVWESDGKDPPTYICKTAPDPPDLLCDSDYFTYETEIDVKNVVEHTLTLPDGYYFFAATAYNDKYPARNNESKFSIELSHSIGGPKKLLNFRKLEEIKGEEEGK